jgi:pimeloyl-ACP methyl ester carboxylesterase
MNIERYGSGPTLLLIHGSPGSSQTWRGIGKKLAERYSIVAPTLPGHGVGDPVDVQETDAIAAATLSALGKLSEPVTIAAHSFGAVLALQMALSGRLQIARLVLFEPVAFAILPATGEQAAFDAAKPIFDGYAAKHRAGDPDAVAIMADFWFGAGAFAKMPPPVQGFMRQQAPVNVRDVEAVFRERYALDAWRRLTMPVMVAYGDRSPAVARLIAEKLAAALPQGRAVAIAGANHGMLASHPDVVAQLIAGD